MPNVSQTEIAQIKNIKGHDVYVCKRTHPLIHHNTLRGFLHCSFASLNKCSDRTNYQFEYKDRESGDIISILDYQILSGLAPCSRVDGIKSDCSADARGMCINSELCGQPSKKDKNIKLRPAFYCNKHMIKHSTVFRHPRVLDTMTRGKKTVSYPNGDIRVFTGDPYIDGNKGTKVNKSNSVYSDINSMFQGSISLIDSTLAPVQDGDNLFHSLENGNTFQRYESREGIWNMWRNTSTGETFMQKHGKLVPQNNE